MKIQSLSGKVATEIEEDGIIYSPLENPRALDDFDINIIQLNYEGIWKCENHLGDSLYCLDDFSSIQEMLGNSKTSVNIIVYPQNVYLEFNADYNGDYDDRILLKNRNDDLAQWIDTLFEYEEQSLPFAFENTKTVLVGKEYNASFHFVDFDPDRYKVIGHSIKSNKATIVEYLPDTERPRRYLTTLDIVTSEDIKRLLEAIGFERKENEPPEWFEEIEMFDDSEKTLFIENKNEEIKRIKSTIDIARKVLDNNNKYKSILYINGDKLVKIVFEIMQDMFGCDLSEFQDKKKEDYGFSINNQVFIGEIKGINDYAKSRNITQLETHYRDFLEKHEEFEEEDVKASLIISHQRNKALEERLAIDDKVVRLADKRYGSLIIETNTLLKLYEKYRLGEVDRNQCINLLSTKTGLLTVNDF